MKTKELETLLKEGKGALPEQMIRSLMDEKFIQHALPNPGPASLDLALGEECYEIKEFILPRKKQEVFSLIKTMGGKRNKSNILMPGKQYLICHEEAFTLPRSVYGYANPKSTTGRSFVHARAIADGVSLRDHLPREFRGRLWSLVTPKVFPVSYEPNKDSMNQMRIFTSDARLSEFAIQSLQIQYAAMKDELNKKMEPKASWIRGGDHGYMIFSADCNGVDGVVGYEAISRKDAIPIGGVKVADGKKYFKPIYKDDYICLVPDKYYILSTQERISIPPDFAAEVKAIDERYGEFRTHYAGFFDPGFGYDAMNPLAGNTMTLEVKVFEKTMLWHGQPIACLQFERMLATPDKMYNQTSGTYRSQIGAKLGKQFV